MVRFYVISVPSLELFCQFILFQNCSIKDISNIEIHMHFSIIYLHFNTETLQYRLWLCNQQFMMVWLCMKIHHWWVPCCRFLIVCPAKHMHHLPPPQQYVVAYVIAIARTPSPKIPIATVKSLQQHNKLHHITSCTITFVHIIHLSSYHSCHRKCHLVSVASDCRLYNCV
jgi:hypothetical protein